MSFQDSQDMKPDMKQSLTYDSSTGKMYAELGSTTQSSNQESNRYLEQFISVYKIGTRSNPFQFLNQDSNRYTEQSIPVLKPGIKQVSGSIHSRS